MTIPFHRFSDREAAGKILAQALQGYAGHLDTVVMALPRGGVPVAAEVARSLSLPFDLWLVRKLGVPDHEEIALGALAVGDVRVFNEEIIRHMGIGKEAIEAVIAKEKAELIRRNKAYRQEQMPPDVAGKAVIVIDDGLATGATMRAAVLSLRQAGAVWVVAAIPVGAAYVCATLRQEADEVVCPFMPDPFDGVGRWYDDFSQVTDEEVQAILHGDVRHAALRA